MIFHLDEIKRYYYSRYRPTLRIIFACFGKILLKNVQKKKNFNMIDDFMCTLRTPAQLNFQKLTQAVVLIFGEYLQPENFAFG